MKKSPGNLKVVHITTVHVAFDNRILYKECSTLASHGYDVSLIASTPAAEVVNSVKIIPLQKYKNRLLRFVLGSLHAFKLALSLNADIYHFHDPELLFVAQIFRCFGRRVIFDMHENVPASIVDKTWIPKKMRRVVRFFYLFMERILLHGVNLIYAEDSYKVSYVCSKSSAVVLNYPFLSLTEKSVIRHQLSEKYLLGYMGGVTSARGIDLTLDALKIIDDKSMPIEWHCVGGGDPGYLEQIQKKINSFKSVKVIMYGRMKPSDGFGVMAMCDVGLAVLQPIGNYVESYPTKMFEYMALGMPVIVSNFKLYKDVVDSNDCGITVNPQSAEDLAAAIVRLYNNREDGMRMGMRGRSAVIMRYNWESQGENLMNIYKEVMRQ